MIHRKKHPDWVQLEAYQSSKKNEKAGEIRGQFEKVMDIADLVGVDHVTGHVIDHVIRWSNWSLTEINFLVACHFWQENRRFKWIID